MAHWYTIDNESPLIAYSGRWDLVRGDGHSGGSVYSTTEIGATATFRWKGRGIKIWMSAPTGDWNQISSYLINGEYIERHIECKTVPTTLKGPHIMVIKQEGNSKFTRGGAPVQLDRIEVLTSDLDPNPAPIYPPEYSPPNIGNPNPPSSTNPSTSSGSVSPKTASLPLPTRGPDSAINPLPRGPIQDSSGAATKLLETTIVVTSGSSTLTVETNLPVPNPSLSLGQNDRAQPVITKVIPNRVYTTTDSTGGIAVRTEFVAVEGGKSSGPSTGLLVGVIVSVLLLLVGLIATGFLLWRRKQSKNRIHAGGDRDKATPAVAEWVLHKPLVAPRGDSPTRSSPLLPNNPLEPSQHRRSFRMFPSTLTDSVPDDAPPAYRMSFGSLYPVAVVKEQASLAARGESCDL
ncbi:hypothetical protein BKA70DRAFT_1268819 [Coprinopsis sp. MPI-PUGE-AT-0042]|nr:hypothetical protein BKA70DRAFT_1268819 [Coprinopsis sp. MPI-PUGE-AT-0042]